MHYKLIEEDNNRYTFEILSDNCVALEEICIYAPNYNTAISRLENYIKSQE